MTISNSNAGLLGNASEYQLTGLVAEYADIADRILIARNDAKGISDRAKALGLNPKLLKAAAKRKLENRLQAEKRATEADTLRAYFLALGFHD